MYDAFTVQYFSRGTTRLFYFNYYNENGWYSVHDAFSVKYFSRGTARHFYYNYYGENGCIFSV